MGYGLVAHAVPFGALKKYIGSKDERTLRSLRLGLTNRSQALDELFSHSTTASKAPALTALEHIIAGEGYQEGVGRKYTYILEDICRQVGAFVDNSNFCPFRGSYLTRAEVKDAYAEMRPARYIGWNPEISEAIETIREWLAVCTRREHGLLCFYY